MAQSRLDLVDDRLRHFLKADAREVSERLLGPPNRALSSRDELRWGDKGGLAVALRGPNAGTWYDFGATAGGDMLSLIQRETGGDFARAVEWARSATGVAPETHAPAVSHRPRETPPADLEDDARRARKVEYARRLAGESMPSDGTPADHYLRQVRGVPRPEGGWPDAVRWHPGHRALLVVATDHAGAVQGVQRVHLTPDGAKIGEAERIERKLRSVKISNGVFSDAAVRLSAREGDAGRGDAPKPLLVAEGPETGLAAWASTGHETWIALGSVGKVQPPAGRPVVLVADDNPRVTEPRIGAAERGVEKTLSEWRERGVEVVRALPWPERRHDRSDFADVILHHGPDAVRERIAHAVESPALTRPEDSIRKGPEMSAPAPIAADDPRHRDMGFTEQHIETNYRLAHTLGVVSRVEHLAAEGLTARQTVERLGPALDRVDELARLNGEPHFAEKNKDDLVRAVRNKLDIPNQEDRLEFAAWVAARGQESVQTPSPTPGERRSETTPVTSEPGDVPPVRGRDEGRAGPLSPDAQTIYQAVSKLLETHHVIAAEDLKPHVSAMLAAREATDGRIELTPDIRIAAGKPPVHTLDEMREVFAAVRERAAVPSDRLAPEAAAEVRQSLQDQIAGSRSMADLMKFYGQDDTQRAMKSLEAHPEQSRLLTDAMETAGKRFLAEDRVKLGLDEPAAARRSFTSPTFDAPDGTPVRPGARGIAADPEAPAAAAFTIFRRGDNGAPATPERAVEPANIARDYEVREKGDERHYHRRDDGKLAIRATETHIHGVRRDAATIGTMLDIAASRGWNDVQVRGDRDVARQVWIEASVRGMRAEGYQPTRDDRHAVEQRQVERREQGLDAPTAPPASGERARATDAPQRRQDRAEAGAGDGEFGGGMAPRGAAAARAERQDRNAWTTGTGGFDGLNGRQQQHAEQAYEKWAAMNPDRTFDLRGYVSHVQEKQAERREAREERGRDRTPERDRGDERQPHMPAPRKIELPGRSMGF